MKPRRRIILALAAGLVTLAAIAAFDWTRATLKERDETIVLLHGMGRGRASMLILAHGLESRGYRVLNFPYDEQERKVVEIASDLRKYIAAEVGGKPYHLVGHSLGNIVIRSGFTGDYPAGLGRIVMLAPPNHPALLAGKLADNPIYRWTMGDAGQRLSDEEFYRTLPTPTVPFGVIAGSTGQFVTFKEANDGVVLVENTKLPGMADWVALPHIHTFIMNGDDTLNLIVRFLDTGKF